MPDMANSASVIEVSATPRMTGHTDRQRVAGSRSPSSACEKAMVKTGPSVLTVWTNETDDIMRAQR